VDCGWKRVWFGGADFGWDEDVVEEDGEEKLRPARSSISFTFCVNENEAIASTWRNDSNGVSTNLEFSTRIAGVMPANKTKSNFPQPILKLCSQKSPPSFDKPLL